MLRALVLGALVGLLACSVFSLRENIDRRNEIQYLQVQNAHITACIEYGGRWEDNRCKW